MKKLILIASLLLSLNSWAEIKPFEYEDEELQLPEYNKCPMFEGQDYKQPCRTYKTQYKDTIQCFSSNGVKIVDLEKVEIVDHELEAVRDRDRYIDYENKDGSYGEIKNISSTTTCHFTYPETIPICVYDNGKEVDMKFCKNKDYKE